MIGTKEHLHDLIDEFSDDPQLVGNLCSSSGTFYNPFLVVMDAAEDFGLADEVISELQPGHRRVSSHFLIEEIEKKVKQLSWRFVTDLTIRGGESEVDMQPLVDFFTSADLSNIKAIHLGNLEFDDALVDSMLKCKTLENLDIVKLPRLSKLALKKILESGFLEDIQRLSMPAGQYVDELTSFDFPNLIYLKTFSSAKLIECIEHTGQYPKLKELSLLDPFAFDVNDNNPTPISALTNAIKLSSRLHALEMDYVTNAGFRQLAQSKFPKLCELDLSYGQFKGGEPFKALDASSFPQLAKLKLFSTPLGDDGLRQLSKWDRLFALESLNLCNTEISSAGIRALTSAAANHQIKWRNLDISNNYKRAGMSRTAKIFASDLETLFAQPNWSANVKRFNLSNCDMSDTKFHLWNSKIQTGLEIIELTETNLGDEELNSLCTKAHFKNLSELIVGKNTKISEAGISSILTGSAKDSIVKLDLSGCCLNDNGIKGFSENMIQVLDLGFNDISSAGMLSLIKSNKFRNVRELSITGNYLEDDFADSFLASSSRTLPNLMVLNLVWHCMESDAVDRLLHLGSDQYFDKILIKKGKMPGANPEI